MAITIRPDDSGLQSLKKENTTPTERALSAVQAVARIRTVSEQERHAAAARIAGETPYTGPERRKGERRQGQQRVILDTRAHRERRRQMPPAGEGEDTGDVKIGVDIYS